MSFTHLHVHTEYSTLDSHATLEGYLERAAKLGQEAVAITDHGVISGAIQFYTQAREMGIKPIIGSEIYVDFDHGVVVEKGKWLVPDHLTVLAANEEGYRDLIRFQKVSHAGFYYRPRFQLADTFGYMKNWIVLSGCMSSTISKLILKDRLDDAADLIRHMQQTAKGFFLEVMRHDSEVERFNVNAEKIIEAQYHLSKQLGVPLVATNDCHFVTKQSEQVIRDFFAATGDKETGVETDNTGMYFKSAKAMRLAGHDQECLDNTYEIARVCRVKIPEADKLTWYVPPDPKHPDPVKTLDMMCRHEVKKLSPEYHERYKKELAVLRQTEAIAQSYLVAHDVVAWCEENGIIASGRGSMAGSLVSWLLGITREDPVKYALKFERAVNPARPVIPDFDIDVSSSRRQEVLDYLKSKYPNACQIGTYVKFGPRAATRFVMRKLGHDFIATNNVTTVMPDTWEDLGDEEQAALHIPPEIVRFVMTYQGIFSTQGVHPAGYLISGDERPLDKEIPMMMIPTSKLLVSQYDMYTLKKLGLYKLDILGLKALDQITKMAELTDEAPDDEYTDPKVFEAITSGLVTDIFQLDGHAARSVIRELGIINDFEDVVVVNTISRPGAAQFIDDYKQGNSTLLKRYPQIESVLGYSRGVILYQEQLMEICAILAGFDDAEQDVLIQAMKRFGDGEFQAMTDRFMDGCRRNGVNGKVIWDALLKFAGYAFNRAHAVSYAGLAYRMMWYKVNHPTAFYAAVFDESEHKRELILESYNFDVKWSPPDIDLSQPGTTMLNDTVLLGLETMKGVGPAASMATLAARKLVLVDGKKEKTKKSRRFADLEDFKARVERRQCNVRVQEVYRKMGLFGDPVDPKDHLEILELPMSVFSPTLTKAAAVRTANQLGGLVLDIKPHIIKNGNWQGKTMGFMTLANADGVFKCVLFPDTWRKFRRPAGRRLDAVVLRGSWTDKGDFIVEGGKGVYEGSAA